MILDPFKFIDYPLWAKSVVTIWLILSLGVLLIALYVKPSTGQIVTKPQSPQVEQPLQSKTEDNKQKKENSLTATSKKKEKQTKKENSESEQQVKSGIIIKGNTFINNKVGVSAPKDANIKMDANNFEGNEKSIDIRDK